MSEFLFPVPGSVLRKLLDFKAKRGQEFTEKEAIADIMLAEDRDDIKPVRYLASRWQWSPSKVHRWKERLLQEAECWRKFNHNNTPVEVKQSETRVKQSETKNAQNRGKKAHNETQVKQSETRVKQYRTDTDKDTDISNINSLNNNQPSATSKGGSARARFAKPKPKELQDYFDYLKGTSGLNFSSTDETQKFLDHYDSNGWRVGGKSAMKDWRAAARNWSRRIKEQTNVRKTSTYSNSGNPTTTGSKWGHLLARDPGSGDATRTSMDRGDEACGDQPALPGSTH